MLHVKNILLVTYTLKLHDHTCNTRNCRTIDRPYCRLSKVLHYFEFECVDIHLFNKIPDKAHIVSFGNFKRVLHKWLFVRQAAL